VTRLSYVDASALVKLAVAEADSAAMHRWYVESERVATSRIGLIEARRAASRGNVDRAHLRFVLDSLEVIEVDARVADRAAGLGPSALRTLDAIHLASALELGQELDAFVTYDGRLAEAARAVGLPVVSPA
jgi:uncharacterized protein